MQVTKNHEDEPQTLVLHLISDFQAQECLNLIRVEIIIQHQVSTGFCHAGTI